MKICPKAPQAANPSISGRIAGLREMKARAADISEPLAPLGERGVGGRRGDAMR